MKFDGQFKWINVIKVNGDRQSIFINGRWLPVNKITVGVLR